MGDIEPIVKKLMEFRRKRNWEQFNTPKDLAISLALEAAEVLEHFQWKTDKEVEAYVKAHKEKIGEELADVFNWILVLAHDLNIDILKAAKRKIRINERKYPVKKAKGKTTKYTEL